MSCITRDLTLEEALADPVIGAVLKADRVDRSGFEALLRRTARRLEGGPPPRPAALAAFGRGPSKAGDICAW